MEATNWSWHFSWVWSDMPRYAQSGDTIQIKNFVTCWVNVSIWKLKIDLVILDGCGQVCQGMVKVLRNNQWPISQEFCLEVFVNYSYHFSSIWSDMSGHPKVYKNNRSAISLSTKKYLVTVLVFFVCNSISMGTINLSCHIYRCVLWYHPFLLDRLCLRLSTI